jgi:hypothetical protein
MNVGCAMSDVGCVCRVVAVVVGGVMAGSAGASVPAYLPTGAFSLPSAASVFDIGADGRAVVVDESGTILRESFPYASSYAAIGHMPGGLVPSFGAGFARLSPDGLHLAVGDNGTVNQMWVVPMGSLSPGGMTAVQTINVPNYDGAWTSSGRLYVNGSPSFGTSPSLYRVDITTGAGAAVVSGIGDGSGGVAARAGRVYTAIGYDAAPGGPSSGITRSFDVAVLDGAGASVAFSTGAFAAQANSGSSLAFDNGGNLIIAGAGGVAVFDLATSQRYDLPGLSALGFYSATWDGFTGEILVRDYGSTTVLHYGVVPAPGVFGLLACSGVLSLRRRRRFHRDHGGDTEGTEGEG